MRISSLTTDEALDVLCEITPYIADIVGDEELLAELKREVTKGKVLSEAELKVLGLQKINALVPLILKKKKADVYGILAALNGKTEEDIAKQNVLITGHQIREIVKDKELLDFFKSFVDGEGNG